MAEGDQIVAVISTRPKLPPRKWAQNATSPETQYLRFANGAGNQLQGKYPRTQALPGRVDQYL